MKEIKVGLDMRTDLSLAGLSTDDYSVATATVLWRAAAEKIAESLGVYVTIVTDASDWDHCDPTHDENGSATLAGRIWQGAHDAIDIQDDGYAKYTDVHLLDF